MAEGRSIIEGTTGRSQLQADGRESVGTCADCACGADPLGACCAGATTPNCIDGLTESLCDLIDGTWYEGRQCEDDVDNLCFRDDFFCSEEACDLRPTAVLMILPSVAWETTPGQEANDPDGNCAACVSAENRRGRERYDGPGSVLCGYIESSNDYVPDPFPCFWSGWRSDAQFTSCPAIDFDLGLTDCRASQGGPGPNRFYFSGIVGAFSPTSSQGILSAQVEPSISPVGTYIPCDWSDQEPSQHCRVVGSPADIVVQIV